MTGTQGSLEEQVKLYQSIQDEISSLAQLRNQYYQKVNENGMVKKELEQLKLGAKVYKLVGPVLIHQELDEVKVNVSKRIDLIQGELTKVSTQIEEKTKSQSFIGDEVKA